MRLLKTAMAAALTLTGLTLFAGAAMAGCGPEGLGSAGLKPMMFRGDAMAGGLERTAFFGPFNTSAITGLWKFELTAKGNTGSNAPAGALPLPDGTPVDAGFATWHDDGTELMNSGRAPVTGSFCMGVWKQTGLETFKLNHWALSWVPDYQPGQTQSWGSLAGGVDEAFHALGPANIQEVVTLADHGQVYAGTFRLTQYVNDGTKGPITDTNGAPVAFVIVGTVTGTRVSP
ncbi:MAG TPA: hypothetical protein VMF03_07615 [Steroidobacteraceae bacterium]|nr:hypothetical protein [Steroidobacteraceae bacterium]